MADFITAPIESTPSGRQYRLIHDIYILLDAGDRHVLNRFNLTKSQYRILTLLDLEHGQRLTTLSDRMLCARSTITRLIDQMEAAGLVHRIDDPEDRRAQRVALTPDGAALCGQARVVHEASLEQRMNGIPESDHHLLLSLLERIRLVLQTQLGDQIIEGGEMQND